jgi:hypothetical protein
VVGDPLQLQEILQDFFKLSSRYKQLEYSDKINGQFIDHKEALKLLKEQRKQQDDESTNFQDCYEKLPVQFHTKVAEANKSPLDSSEDDIKLFTQHHVIFPLLTNMREVTTYLIMSPTL